MLRILYLFCVKKTPVNLMTDVCNSLFIISPEHEKITSYILHEVDRGVTLVNGNLGYTKKTAELVLSQQVPRIERQIRQIDHHLQRYLSLLWK